MALKLYAFSDSSSTRAHTINTDPTSSDITIPATTVQTTPPAFFAIPTYAFSDKSNGCCNSVVLAMRYTGDSIDDIESVVFRTPISLSLLSEATLAKYPIASSFTLAGNGLYYYGNGSITGSTFTAIQTGVDAAIAKAIDNTKDGIQVDYTQSGTAVLASLALQLSPPNVTDISFDSIALGLRTLIHGDYISGVAGIGLYGRHFFGASKQLLYNLCESSTGNVYDNIPSESLADDTGDNSNYFIKRDAVTYTLSQAERDGNSLYDNISIPASHFTARVTSGLTNSIFTINATADVIRQFKYLVLVLRGAGSAPSSGFVRIVELCYMFIKKLSIKSELFAPMQGRVFNGAAWTTGRINYTRASNALIADPVDILEHINRLQNWSETGAANTPGITYADAAKINTNILRGGFDCTQLASIRACRPGFQVLEEGEAWTDKLKKELCSTFFMASFNDRLGRECVADMLPNAAVAQHTITLADIIGSIGEVEEPKADAIFAEPWVSYNYNYGSSKYDSSLSVTNIQQSSWKAVYTPGFNCAILRNESNTKSDGQYYWEQCKALYDKYHTIEKPSGTQTDKKLIRTYTDAVWYLNRWLRLMELRRISFNVPYSMGKIWELFDIVSINFPHQTSNTTVLAEIESLKISRTTGKCAVSVVLLDYL